MPSPTRNVSTFNISVDTVNGAAEDWAVAAAVGEGVDTAYRSSVLFEPEEPVPLDWTAGSVAVTVTDGFANAVGVAVGVHVAITVGPGVGIGVGTGVAVGLGVGVGVAVGVGVGVTVGVGVGVDVWYVM